MDREGAYRIREGAAGFREGKDPYREGAAIFLQGASSTGVRSLVREIYLAARRKFETWKVRDDPR